MMPILLERGANLDNQDADRQTALHYADFNGHETVIRILLKQGKNINVKDNWGEAALYKAARYEYEMVLQKLLM